MSVFSLSNAVEVLHSRYEAYWVEAYHDQSGLEADVGLFLDNKILMIEFSVELRNKCVRVNSILTAQLPTQASEGLHFRNETHDYAQSRSVVDFIQRIKDVIGLSEFTTR